MLNGILSTKFDGLVSIADIMRFQFSKCDLENLTEILKSTFR